MNDASAAANTTGEPCRAADCGGIAAANVGIFAETRKRKRRFVPNLRTGGANCFLSRLREAMRPLPSCGRCSRRARPVYRRAEWRAKTRNFSMLFGRLGQNLGLSEICSQVVTTTSAIFLFLPDPRKRLISNDETLFMMSRRVSGCHNRVFRLYW